MSSTLFKESFVNEMASDIASSTMLFKSPHTKFHWQCLFTGYEFDAPFIDVFYAEYCANRNMAIRGYISINEFFDFISVTDHKDCKYDRIGWSVDGWDFYGYSWIDFSHDYDPVFNQFLLSYPFEPHDLKEWIGEEAV